MAKLKEKSRTAACIAHASICNQVWAIVASEPLVGSMPRNVLQLQIPKILNVAHLQQIIVFLLEIKK